MNWLSFFFLEQVIEFVRMDNCLTGMFQTTCKCLALKLDDIRRARQSSRQMGELLTSKYSFLYIENKSCHFTVPTIEIKEESVLASPAFRKHRKLHKFESAARHPGVEV